MSNEFRDSFEYWTLTTSFFCIGFLVTLTLWVYDVAQLKRKWSNAEADRLVHAVWIMTTLSLGCFVVMNLVAILGRLRPVQDQNCVLFINLGGGTYLVAKGT